MSKYAPPPSPEAAIAELEEIDRFAAKFEALDKLEAQNANEIAELEELERLAEQNATEIAASFLPDPEPETISLTDLLLLGIEPRLARIADALENAVKADRNNFEALTAQVHRLADAFETMAGFIGCVTESIEGADDKVRCYVRTYATSNVALLSKRPRRGLIDVRIQTNSRVANQTIHCAPARAGHY
jgi:hypothetical protein